MANWQIWQVSLGMAVFIFLCFFLPWKFKRIGKFLLSFDNTDRALAFFALFFAFQVLVQQSANYPYGIVYQLSFDDAREVINQGTKMHEWYTRYGVAVMASYWLLTACILFFVVSIFRGLWRDIRNQKKESKNIGQINKEIRQHLNKMGGGLNEYRDSNNKNPKV
jgi:hypothetical protein